jgi:hypothetical protein
MDDVEPVLTKYQAEVGGDDMYDGGMCGGAMFGGDASDPASWAMFLLAAVVVLVLVLLAWHWLGRKGRHHRQPVVYGGAQRALPPIRGRAYHY